jgi:hypothetical protein
MDGFEPIDCVSPKMTENWNFEENKDFFGWIPLLSTYDR